MNGTGFKGGLMPKAIICYICGRGYGTKSIGIHIKNCQKKWDIDQNNKPPKERKPCPQPPKGFMDLINKPNIARKELEKINNIAFEEYNDVALEPCSFCCRTFNSEAFKIHQRICTAEKPFKPLNKPITTKPIVRPDIEIDKPKMTKTATLKKGSSDNNTTLELQNNYQFNFPNKNGNSTSFSKTNTLSKANKKSITVIKEVDNNFMDIGYSEESSNLIECSKCGRNFASDRILKHQSVCVVNKKPKKVKVFHKVVDNVPKKTEEQTKIPKWKAQHQALVENMKYMRKVKKAEIEGKDIRSIPVPINNQHNQDLKECKYCGRKFNEESHIRHENICRNVVNKPKQVNKKR